jgi:hypothetical protein
LHWSLKLRADYERLVVLEISSSKAKQGWRMAFLYNLPMLVIIPTGGSVLPA